MHVSSTDLQNINMINEEIKVTRINNLRNH